jgi:hypothetical protein
LAGSPTLYPSRGVRLRPEAELELEIDGTDRLFSPGAPIAGLVRVSPDSLSFGRPLVVALWWQSTGAGDVDRGDERVLTLAPANAPIAGRAYPFAFPAPAGPLSYRGPTFSIEWRIEARLGRPASSRESPYQGVVIHEDPDAPVRGIAAEQLPSLGAPEWSGEQDAVLSRDQVVRLLEQKDRLDDRAAPARVGCACLAGFWLCSFVVLPLDFVAALFGGGEGTLRRIFDIYSWAWVGLFVAGLVGLLVFRGIERRLGLSIGFRDRVVRPGDDLVCVVGLRPLRAVAMARIEMTVIGEATASGSDGGGAPPAELCRAVVVVPVSRTYEAHLRQQVLIRATIPRDAAASFESRWHGVQWRAVVSVVPDRGMTVVREYAFIVHPTRWWSDGGPARR